MTSSDVHATFVKPITELTKALRKTCARWEQAVREKRILRDDLYLNVASAKVAIATLYKLQREVSGKLDDAIAGVYRYRESERRSTKHKKKKA